MATTPEGKIKSKINAVLKVHYPRVKYFMPVPGGYGQTTVDYIGVAYGRAFAIEAKRPGKEPSYKQQAFLGEWFNAGGTVFAINSDEGVEDLADWLVFLAEDHARFVENHR